MTDENKKSGKFSGHTYIDTSTTNKFTDDYESMIVPAGYSESMSVLAVFNDRKMPTNEKRLNDTNPRVFIINAAFSKTFLISNNFDTSTMKGDSHINCNHNNNHVLEISSSRGNVSIYCNDDGEWSMLKFECIATDHMQARHKFFEMINPQLDYLSYLCEIPFFINRVSAHDKKNEITSFFRTKPYANYNLNISNLSVTGELDVAYSLYREAKNSHSNFYKFLCLYKILEGIYTHLRPKLFKLAQQNNIRLKKIRDIVPDCPRHPKNKLYCGKSIKKIFEDRFKKLFRNRIAHYVTSSDYPLSPSNFFANYELENDLIWMEECVRVCINNHEKILKEYDEMNASKTGSE